MNKMVIIEKYKQAVVEMVKMTVDNHDYLDMNIVSIRNDSICDAVNDRIPGLIKDSKLVWVNYGKWAILFYQLYDGKLREYEFKF